MRSCLCAAGLALFALAGPESVGSQTMYRCGNTFSQTPCGENSTTSTIPKSGRSTTVADHQARVLDMKMRCAALVKGLPAWKDPSSVRMDGIYRGKAEVRQVHGQPLVVIPYYAMADGKNSYGAYPGQRPYACYANEAETRIIDFYQP